MQWLLLQYNFAVPSEALVYLGVSAEERDALRCIRCRLEDLNSQEELGKRRSYVASDLLSIQMNLKAVCLLEDMDHVHSAFQHAAQERKFALQVRC